MAIALVCCIALIAQAEDAVLSRVILAPGNTILSHPAALVIGVGGLIYIADTGNNRLVAMDAMGTIQVESSKGGSAGELRWPADVAVGPAGKIYVADKGKRKIFEFTRLLEWKGELVIADAEGNALAPNLLATNSVGDLVAFESDENQLVRYDEFFNVIARLGGQSGQSVPEPSCLEFSDVYGVLWIDKQENQTYRTDPVLSHPEIFRECGVLPPVHQVASADSTLFFAGESSIFRFSSSVLDSSPYSGAGIVASPWDIRLDAVSPDSLIILDTRSASLLGLHWP